MLELKLTRSRCLNLYTAVGSATTVSMLVAQPPGHVGIQLGVIVTVGVVGQEGLRGGSVLVTIVMQAILMHVFSTSGQRGALPVVHV
jgi:hypothetical protein